MRIIERLRCKCPVTRWEVEGQTDNYVVTMVNDKWKCSCPHAIHRQVECKHIDYVRSMELATLHDRRREILSKARDNMTQGDMVYSFAPDLYDEFFDIDIQINQKKGAHDHT